MYVSVAEWSKASDSSSDGAIRVGSNPTAVNFFQSKSFEHNCFSSEAHICTKTPPTGIEPVTLRLTASRSNQLS